MCEHFQKMEELGFLFIWLKPVNVGNSQPLLVIFHKNCHVDDNATLGNGECFLSLASSGRRTSKNSIKSWKSPFYFCSLHACTEIVNVIVVEGELPHY